MALKRKAEESLAGPSKRRSIDEGGKYYFTAYHDPSGLMSISSRT